MPKKVSPKVRPTKESIATPIQRSQFYKILTGLKMFKERLRTEFGDIRWIIDYIGDNDFSICFLYEKLPSRDFNVISSAVVQALNLGVQNDFLWYDDKKWKASYGITILDKIIRIKVNIEEVPKNTPPVEETAPTTEETINPT